MTKYTWGLYRNRGRLTDDIERRTLEALETLHEGFFPAVMRISGAEKIVFVSARDYSRLLIPPQYYISPEIATIPLEATNGVDLVFTESDEPKLYPASLVFQCSREAIDANKWGAKKVLQILRETIRSLEPDYGFVYDEAQRARDSYGKVMFRVDTREVPIGSFWINYYGPRWVKNIGAEALERIKKLAPLFEELDGGGVLFALQEDPYSEENPIDQQGQLAFEKAVGLKEIQNRFPNRGL